jgi:amphiphysin
MHDEKMKDLIPSIMDAISAFFAPMLNIMYAIQADLFQHLYASVYEYATAQGLTNTENLVEECNSLYEPMRQRAESEIKSLREGKVARTPFGETGKPGMFARKSSTSTTTTTATSRPSVTKSSSPAPPPPYTQQPEARRPSGNFAKLPPPPAPPSGPSPLLTPSSYGGSRTPSSSSINSDAVKKKKPPPPPPPKPSVSPKPEFVVAKYDFAGESQGDLAFKAGDRIKIIKKTESTEDWWEGELNGSRGMFPRNYCD